MDKIKKNIGSLCQIGIIVKDIEKAVRTYSNLLALPVPKIMVSESQEKAHTTFRGAPTDARAKMAFFDLGQVTIELIEPTGGPSTWREFLENKGDGYHHIAFKVDSTEEALKNLSQEGIEVIQQGDYPGGRYTYCAAESTPDLTIELLQDTDNE